MLQLTDEFVSRFEQEGYGCIASFCCIDGVNWQTHLFAYLPNLEIKFTQKKLELDLKLTIKSKDNNYPLVLLSASVTNNSAELLCLDVYLNPLKESEGMAIEGLTVQTTLGLHFFKEDFSYYSTLEVPWYSQVESWEIYLLALNMAEDRKRLNSGGN
ncbi:MAG: hypothetical protein WA131_00075 [Desulfitobacteriaceae bacterium]